MLKVRFKKNGFSVSEILVSLFILGFVGYLSYAILIKYTEETKKNVIEKKSIEQQAYTYSWQGQYQNLTQAANMVILNNNNNFENLCQDNQPNKCMKDLFAANISTVNSCENNTRGTCWHNDGNWYSSNNVPANENISTAFGFIMNNGTLVLFNNTDTTCPNGICGQIYFDVNGFDKPNTLGFDIFKINILKNSLSPVQ